MRFHYHSGLTQVQHDVSNDPPLIENSQIIEYDGIHIQSHV